MSIDSASFDVSIMPRMGDVDDTGRIQRCVNMALTATTSVGSLSASAVYFPTATYFVSSPAGSNQIALDLTGNAGLFPLNRTGGTVVAFGGPLTAGDTIALSPVGGPFGGSAAYTVTPGESWFEVAAGLAAAINNNTNWHGSLICIYAGAVRDSFDGAKLFVLTTFPMKIPLGYGWTSMTSGTQTGAAAVSSISYPAGKIANPRLKLLGDGAAQTILCFTAETSTSPSSIFAAWGCENVGGASPQIEFCGFNILQHGSPVSPHTATAIDLGGLSHTANVTLTSIHDMEFGNLSVAVHLQNASLSCLNNLEIVGCREGIFLDIAGTATISNCVIGPSPAAQSGAGIHVNGGNDGSVNLHVGEGVTVSNVQTDGQYIGLLIENSAWGTVSSCSFTTCPGGALVARQLSGTTGYNAMWQFSATQFSVGTVDDQPASSAAVITDEFTSEFTFSSCSFALSLIGMLLRGTASGGGLFAVTGCHFTSNTFIDIDLLGVQRCNITGNILASSTSSGYSINEANGAARNLVTSNLVAGLVGVADGWAANNNGI